MVPIGSPSIVSCITYIVSNTAFLTAFEIFDVKALLPRSKKGSRSSKVKDDGAYQQHMGDFLFVFY